MKRYIIDSNTYLSLIVNHAMHSPYSDILEAACCRSGGSKQSSKQVAVHKPLHHVGQSNAHLVFPAGCHGQLQRENE